MESYKEENVILKRGCLRTEGRRSQLKKNAFCKVG